MDRIPAAFFNYLLRSIPNAGQFLTVGEGNDSSTYIVILLVVDTFLLICFFLGAYRSFEFYERSTSFESQCKDVLVLHLPENRLLFGALGNTFWFAPKVSRQHAIVSLALEHYRWIPTINGSLKLAYDQLNYR